MGTVQSPGSRPGITSPVRSLSSPFQSRRSTAVHVYILLVVAFFMPNHPAAVYPRAVHGSETARNSPSPLLVASLTTKFLCGERRTQPKSPYCVRDSTTLAQQCEISKSARSAAWDRVCWVLNCAPSESCNNARIGKRVCQPRGQCQW